MSIVAGLLSVNETEAPGMGTCGPPPKACAKSFCSAANVVGRPEGFQWSAVSVEAQLPFTPTMRMPPKEPTHAWIWPGSARKGGAQGEGAELGRRRSIETKTAITLNGPIRMAFSFVRALPVSAQQDPQLGAHVVE